VATHNKTSHGVKALTQRANTPATPPARMLATLGRAGLVLGVLASIWGTTPVRAACTGPNDPLCHTQSVLTAVEQQRQQIFAALRAKLNADGRDRLAAAEQNWLRFRATNCEFEAQQSQDPPTHKARCLDRMTRHRLEELKRQLAL
jgi:uncharacterized protein YecT (DUF1311 family)